MEWISVEDRFPPDQEPVLVLCFFDYKNLPKEKEYSIGYYSVEARKWFPSYQGIEFYGEGGELDTAYLGDGGYITHWMPLPEPPKDKQNETT